jgi:hypothetical protein
MEEFFSFTLSMKKKLLNNEVEEPKGSRGGSCMSARSPEGGAPEAEGVHKP